MSNLELPRKYPSFSSKIFLGRVESRDSLSENRSYRGIHHEISRSRRSGRKDGHTSQSYDSEEVGGELRENYDEMNLVFNKRE